MAVSLCIISFALGLLAIDMFCDHYSLVSPSLTATQLNTCTLYYQNASRQPWYTSLATLVPMLIGAFVMLRNIRRTVYDMLSVPVFLGVVSLFLMKIKKFIESLAVETKANDTTKAGYLGEIARTHAMMGGLLVVLLVLQVLAERQARASKVKRS